MLILIPTAYEAALLFGDEIAAPLRDGDLVQLDHDAGPLDLALCGFGLAAAGAGGAHWMAELANPIPEAPADVILLGIAGTYDPERFPIGEARFVAAAVCDGIGVGEGSAFAPAEEAGWLQGHPIPDAPPLGDRIELTVPPFAAGLLDLDTLSVAAASADPDHAARRAARHPAALAEDMETYAVALAARLAGLRLAAIRAASNRAGDRDLLNWQSAEAMTTAGGLLQQFFENLEP
jgi:futalosine hydrolase